MQKKNCYVLPNPSLYSVLATISEVTCLANEAISFRASLGSLVSTPSLKSIQVT